MPGRRGGAQPTGWPSLSAVEAPARPFACACTTSATTKSPSDPTSTGTPSSWSGQSTSVRTSPATPSRTHLGTRCSPAVRPSPDHLKKDLKPALALSEQAVEEKMRIAQFFDIDVSPACVLQQDDARAVTGDGDGRNLFEIFEKATALAKQRVGPLSSLA